MAALLFVKRCVVPVVRASSRIEFATALLVVVVTAVLVAPLMPGE